MRPDRRVTLVLPVMQALRGRQVIPATTARQAQQVLVDQRVIRAIPATLANPVTRETTALVALVGRVVVLALIG